MPITVENIFYAYIINRARKIIPLVREISQPKARLCGSITEIEKKYVSSENFLDCWRQRALLHSHSLSIYIYNNCLGLFRELNYSPRHFDGRFEYCL